MSPKIRPGIYTKMRVFKRLISGKSPRNHSRKTLFFLKFLPIREKGATLRGFYGRTMPDFGCRADRFRCQALWKNTLPRVSCRPLHHRRTSSQKTKNQRYDLILLSDELPQMSGIDLIYRIAFPREARVYGDRYLAP